MSWSKLAFRFPWRRARDIRRDVAEELQIHIDQRVDELVAGGMPVAKALHTARVQFGDVRATEQYCIAQDKGAERQRERQRWLGDLARDLRHGWRAMRRRPGFSALAALTLALGIGGTTAIGTVIYRLVVRPFDMPGGTRIVILTETQAGGRVQLIPSPTTLAAWKEGAPGSFESLESTESVQLAVAGEDGLAAQFVRGLGASPGLGAMLHMRPEIGRWFLPGEYGTSPAQVVVLSHRMWRDRFGQAPDIVGRSITLNGDRYEVIGVLPRSGDDPPVSYLAADLWLPAMDWLAGSGRRGTRGIAVLSPGVTREQATARLEVVAAQMAESDPRFETWKPKVTPASQLIGESTRSGMLVLLGASGLLLLLGCANVAQMLLARGVERRQEFGVRAALGASRGRLVRQALAEHAALGLVGGMAGAGVAMILLKLTVDQLPPTLSVLRSFQPGPGLLLGAIGLGLVTVLLFGLYPALEAAFRLSRTSNGQLVPSAQIGSGNRGRSTLLVGQVMVATLIVIGAALLTRSIWQLTRLDAGFEVEGLVAWNTQLPRWRYPSPEAQQALLEQIEASVAALPSVTSISRALSIPPNAGVSFGTLTLADREITEAERMGFFPTTWVHPEFFPTMRSRLLAGRYFLDDGAGEPAGAVVINRFMAERLWTARSAIGKRFRIDEDEMTVVGVVENAPAVGLTEMEDQPQLYLLVPPTWPATNFVARITGDQESAIAAITATIRGIERDVVVTAPEPMRNQIRNSLAAPQFFRLLLSIFALTALAIAATGLIGIVRHNVAHRAREIALRMALGAAPARVRRLVLGQALGPVLVGLAAGAAMAWWGSRILASQLYGLDPRDAAAFAGSILVLLAVAALAAWWPSRQVARVDPMQTLRAT